MVFEKTLVTMVKGLRAAKGEEDHYINQSMQEIKQELQSSNLKTKSMAVLKLAYLNMMGYDILWASFSIVDCMSRADKMSLRRPAYLAASFCFQEKNDLGLMLINHFKKELMSGNKSPTEIGIALSNLAVICTPDMARELINDLISLLSSTKPYIRKKVVLTMFRLFLKYPLALRAAFPKLKERLTDEDQGVLTACVNTFLELSRKNARNYLILVPHFFTLLTQTNNNWLMIKLMKVFVELCPLEPRLATKLADPLIQILSTTRAKSVEFEACRTLVRVLPGNADQVGLAMERLKPFLFSADRNLRYLGLLTIEEYVVRNPQLLEAGELILYPELPEKILETIEETDITIRKVALSILDKIVTKESFPKIAETLIQMSRNNSNSGEYVKTFLNMGEFNDYSMITDFGWYLLALAELAKTSKFLTHAQTVADQFVDISGRVEAVRAYGVSVAHILIIGSEADRKSQITQTTVQTANAIIDSSSEPLGLSACAPCVLQALAWVIGEYHRYFETDEPLEQLADLLSSNHILTLPANTQVSLLWASIKLLCGFAGRESVSEEKYKGLREKILGRLPGFVLSQHVEVAERASLAFFILEYHGEKAKLKGFYPDTEIDAFSDSNPTTLPTVDLDTPFYEIIEEAPPASFLSQQQEPSTPQQATSMTTQQLQTIQQAAQQGNPEAIAKLQQLQAGGLVPNQQNMVNTITNGLNSANGNVSPSAANGTAESTLTPQQSAPQDPLAAMRAKMANNSQQYTIAPKKKTSEGPERAKGSLTGGPMGTSRPINIAQQATAPVLTAEQVANMTGVSGQQNGGFGPSQNLDPNALFLPTDKELQDALSKKWEVWAQDDKLCVYVCAKNKKDDMLRLDLRLEKKGGATGSKISNVKLQCQSIPNLLGGNLNSIELVSGDFVDERSGKIKALLNCNAFPSNLKPCADLNSADGTNKISFEIVYEVEEQTQTIPTTFLLPTHAFLNPRRWTEDEVGSYIADNVRSHLTQQAGEMYKVPVAKLDPILQQKNNSVDEALACIASKTAALSSFHGIKQQGAAESGGPLKFLLISQTNENGGGRKGAAETNPHLVALCMATVKDGELAFKVTVKGYESGLVECVKNSLLASLKAVLE